MLDFFLCALPPSKNICGDDRSGNGNNNSAAKKLSAKLNTKSNGRFPSPTRKDYYAKQTRRVNALGRRPESRWLCCCTVRKIIGCGGKGLYVESRLGSKSQTQICVKRESKQKNFSFTAAAGSSRRVSEKKRVFVRRKAHKSVPCSSMAQCAVWVRREKIKM